MTDGRSGPAYDGAMARVYATGRLLPPQTMALWLDAAARHIKGRAGPVLDLGSGTGRFAEGLAHRLATYVVAVEPAAAMQRQTHPTPRVGCIRARAEALPLGDATIGAIWASQVLHHVHDLPECASEMRRVLRSDGRVLVRGVFGDSFETIGWLAWFPEARSQSSAGTLPLATVSNAFAKVGLQHIAHERLQQIIARDLRELCERTRLRADSVLASLSEQAFRDGLARLEACTEAQVVATPVVEQVDLLVYAR